ncbi:MAG TPA: hypothetical protein VFY39_01090 [Gammaproteobacteria bacterium]|nr:hypothetical protein [Gammaproteobacteria bacterium]
MRDDPENHGRDSRRQAPKNWLARWAEGAIFLAFIMLATHYRPFAHLFHFEAFEQRRGHWPELLILLALWISLKETYYRIYRRDERRAETAAIKEDLLHGRIKRPPLWVRSLLLLAMLVLVCLGAFAGAHGDSQILVVTVPLFLLFALVELNIVLHPGDAMLPDARDELLAFFKARMLQAGYVTAVLALAGVYVVSLFAPKYLAWLLPILLTVTLLVPGLVYRRLDRQADADG